MLLDEVWKWNAIAIQKYQPISSGLNRTQITNGGQPKTDVFMPDVSKNAWETNAPLINDIAGGRSRSIVCYDDLPLIACDALL
jgi:hypothetical protein